MNRRVWILFVALGLSTIFAVRGAFSQGEAQSKRRAINLPEKAGSGALQQRHPCRGHALSRR